jgi:hypothetical protein
MGLALICAVVLGTAPDRVDQSRSLPVFLKWLHQGRPGYNPSRLCGCGEIGRRAGFRFQFPRGSVGSSPIIRTKTNGCIPLI